MTKDRKLTLITCARYLYGDEYKSLLIKEFFNTDLEISLAAIRATATPGHEIAIPYLYQIIEEGVLQQKLQAIAALVEIQAIAAIPRLIEYFNLFKDKVLKEAILHAINEISLLDNQVQELNKAILLSPGIMPTLAEIAVTGLIRSNQTEIVFHHFLIAPPQVQKKVLHLLLESPYEQAADFIKNLKAHAQNLEDDVLGYYLCMLEIKFPLMQNYVIDCLKSGASRLLIRSFLHLLSLYRGEITYPKNLLRIIFIIPYINQHAEILIQDFLVYILPKLKAKGSHQFTYFKLMIKTYLETIYQKIRKQFLSLKGEKIRTNLLAIVFAQLLEKYANPKLLARVQHYFQSNTEMLDQGLLEEILRALKKAPSEDINKLKFCVPLFAVKDVKTRIYITSILSCINLERTNLIRRLNRLILFAGTMQVKECAKKIAEIAEWAHEEKIIFLEEACLKTLCRLNYPPIIDNFIAYTEKPLEHRFSLMGFLQGARYLAPALIFQHFIKLLFNKTMTPEMQTIILDTLDNWDLVPLKTATPSLIKTLQSPFLTDPMRKRLETLITRYANYTHFQSLLDLLQRADSSLKLLYINILKDIALKNHNVPKDILVNRIYAFLDEEQGQDLNIQALFVLADLGDDYAYKVLREQLVKEDALYVKAFIKYFQSHSVTNKTKLTLDLLASVHPLIQKALRTWLDEYLKTEETEQLKTLLVLAFKGSVDGKASAAVKNHKQSGLENKLMQQSKTKFQLLRESTQSLTVLFIDIVNYTQRTTEADPSALMNLIRNFETTVTTEINKFKGNIVKKMGDGILASFIHPLNSVLASLAILTHINEANQFKVEKDKLSVRIGLNTGLVIKKDGDIYGDVVNLASRMETAANPGEILMTQSTFDEVKKYIECVSLGPIQVKGRTEAMAAFRVLALRPDVGLTASAQMLEEASVQETIQSYERLSQTETTPVCDYTFPHHLAPLEPKMKQSLVDVFTDITSAIEEIARDYHEEKALKKYLQAQWDKLIRELN